MDLTHRNMTSTLRAEMVSFLVELDGSRGRVLLQNPAENQRGAFGGTPVVAGGSQSGLSLNIDGCSNNITNWIRVGDWFSVNSELKLCTADANSDGSGLLTLSFAPRLRKSPGDNIAIITSGGAGGFVLEKNSVSWTNKPGDLSDLTLSFLEDIAS